MDFIIGFLIVMFVGLFDSLDPIAFFVTLNILTKKNWKSNLTYFLFFYWLIYFFIGILFFIFLDQFILNGANLGSTSFSLFGLEMVNLIGLVLILIGFYYLFTKQKKAEEKEENKKVSGYKYIFFAFIYILAGLPSSYPYFITLRELLLLGVPIFNGIILILVYTIFFVLPHFLIIIAFKKSEAKTQKYLIKVRSFLSNKYFIGVTLILFGAYLFFS